MINLNSFTKELKPGVDNWWGETYNAHDPVHLKVFDYSDSQDAYEEDVQVSAYGAAVRKGENDSVTFDTARQGYVTRYVHNVWGLGFTISKEAISDGKGVIKAKQGAQALAKSLNHTRELNGANILNRGFNSTYKGGDNVELLSTAHTNTAGGTFANKFATDLDFSEAALEQACINIQKWEDDRGLRINVMPKSIVIPVDMEFDAYRVLKTPYRVGTSDNDLNAINSMGKFPGGVVPWIHLSDTDAWFIKTDCDNGMRYIERWPDEFNSDGEFDTNVVKYKAEGRYVFGWTDPRAMYGSAGA